MKRTRKKKPLRKKAAAMTEEKMRHHCLTIWMRQMKQQSKKKSAQGTKHCPKRKMKRLADSIRRIYDGSSSTPNDAKLSWIGNLLPLPPLPLIMIPPQLVQELMPIFPSTSQKRARGRSQELSWRWITGLPDANASLPIFLAMSTEMPSLIPSSLRLPWTCLSWEAQEAKRTPHPPTYYVLVTHLRSP